MVEEGVLEVLCAFARHCHCSIFLLLGPRLRTVRWGFWDVLAPIVIVPFSGTGALSPWFYCRAAVPFCWTSPTTGPGPLHDRARPGAAQAQVGGRACYVEGKSVGQL